MEYIEINKLIPFREHIFSLYEGERLDNLVASIKQLGVLNPVICRPYGISGNYEILSGHNRVNAAKLAGLTEVPYSAVFPETDEEAMLIVIESNFMQRSLEEMKISERAKSIARWFNCLKSQGFRTDLLSNVEAINTQENILTINQNNVDDFVKEDTKKSFANLDNNNVCTFFSPEGKKYDSSMEIAINCGLSSVNIYRYLRVAKLIEKLLNRMDKFEISIKAAVELSYLSEEMQNRIDIFLDADSTIRITEKIAKELRQYSHTDKLKNDVILEKILKGIVIDKRKVPKRKVVLKEKFLFQYFDKSADDKVISQKLEQSLKLTEQTIPQICRDHNYETTDYDELITDALNKYFSDKTE